MGHCFLKRITPGYLIQSDSTQQSVLIGLHALLTLNLNFWNCSQQKIIQTRASQWQHRVTVNKIKLMCLNMLFFPYRVQGMLQILVAICIMTGYSITIASFAIYEVNEHHNGSKRLQHIAGVSEPFYWIVNFLYDMVTSGHLTNPNQHLTNYWCITDQAVVLFPFPLLPQLIYMIPVTLTVAVIAAFQLPAFTDRQNLGAVTLLLVLFGWVKWCGGGLVHLIYCQFIAVFSDTWAVYMNAIPGNACL